MHRAMVAAEGGIVRLEDLPATIRQAGSHELPAGSDGGAPIEESSPTPSHPNADRSSSWPFESLNLEVLERAAILEAIRQSGGNVTQAMRALGVARTTLYRKLKQYGIEPES